MENKEEKNVIVLQSTSVDIASPKQLGEFATVLKKFIVEQKLYTNIAGKNYVNVEGWQFAGMATGIMPVVKKLEKIELDDSDEIKYYAEVELKSIKSDMIVGGGMAVCSNKERGKGKFEEYAIASMAQTRAVGKAYRSCFAWLMKMAGYETTPFEEMDGVKIKSGTNKKAKSEASKIAEEIKKDE
jgi:hypothetical protein